MGIFAVRRKAGRTKTSRVYTKSNLPKILIKAERKNSNPFIFTLLSTVSKQDLVSYVSLPILNYYLIVY